MTTLRRKIKVCLTSIRENCRKPLHCLRSLLRLVGWTLITAVTIIFWQPITAFFKVFSISSSTDN